MDDEELGSWQSVVPRCHRSRANMASLFRAESGKKCMTDRRFLRVGFGGAQEESSAKPPRDAHVEHECQ